MRQAYRRYRPGHCTVISSKYWNLNLICLTEGELWITAINQLVTLTHFGFCFYGLLYQSQANKCQLCLRITAGTAEEFIMISFIFLFVHKIIHMLFPYKKYLRIATWPSSKASKKWQWQICMQLMLSHHAILPPSGDNNQIWWTHISKSLWPDSFKVQECRKLHQECCLHICSLSWILVCLHCTVRLQWSLDGSVDTLIERGDNVQTSHIPLPPHKICLLWQVQYHCYLNFNPAAQISKFGPHDSRSVVCVLELSHLIIADNTQWPKKISTFCRPPISGVNTDHSYHT